MKSLVLCFILIVVFTTCSSEDWCYESQLIPDATCKGPATWTEVDPLCDGKGQSPINIVTKKAKRSYSLTSFKFTGYKEAFTSMLKNTGQTVVVTIPEGATVSGGNLTQTYKAISVEFHWGKNGTSGSEHTIDGEKYPMEMHIQHIKNSYVGLEDALPDQSGVAMLSFFFVESAIPNKQYSTFIEALKNVQEASTETEFNVSLDSLILPMNQLSSYYRYEGSLTAPSCNEAVVWTVFKHPIPLSHDQLAEFFNLKFSDGEPMVNTFRPVQPGNGRTVYHSGSAVVVASFTLVCVSTALGLFLHI
ncbi:carbonic anhydrase 4-like [Trichomycterus rosablanca]|uniref:carbonic anhydrase 4-like n=1 Tax=Trichomycterus rosablanca TaxID=2290929 RepID=UPI002F35F101